jgi:hypothetical protein
MRANGILVAATVCVLVGFSPRSAIAQTAPAIHFELGNWDLRRHLELVAAGADVVHAAAEAGSRRLFETVGTSRDGRGRMFRITKLYLVDLPTVAVAHTLGHEYGHASRNRENGALSSSFALDNWPWPVPFVNAHTTNGLAGSLFDRSLLAISSGGYEAGRVRDRRFADEFSNTSGVDYFAALRLIYSRVEEPLAAVVYLRESELRDKRLYLFANSSAPHGIDDMSAYALTLTGVRYRGSISEANADAAAREIRGAAPWALLDLELAGSFYRVANYLWTGRAVDHVPSLKVRGNRFWPRATFALTSAGVSRGGEVLWVREHASMKFHAEKTEQAVPLDIVGSADRGRPILADRTRSLWGGGVAVSTSIRATRLRLEGNYWNQDTTGRGGSVEGRFERLVRVLPGLAGTSVSLGYKTAGSLAGAPDAARWFVSAGLTIHPTGW